MHHQNLSVACHLQVAIRLLDDLGDVIKQNAHIPPGESVREWMLEDLVVGPQVRTA
jgi:hypothetical protein